MECCYNVLIVMLLYFDCKKMWEKVVESGKLMRNFTT